MNDIAFFYERLKSKVKDDKELLDKINNPSFLNSLNDVCEVFDALNLEIIERSESFDHKKEMDLKISRALIHNYFVIYYVNLTSDDYISYSNDNDYDSLKIEDSGTDFFKAALKNAEKVIYKDDLEIIITKLNKEKIIKETNKGEAYSFTYRLLLNNKPCYVRLDAIRPSNDMNNLIIGVSNVDTMARREIEYKQKMEDNITYANIALALARDYFAIYYVNLKTTEYIQYSLNNKKQILNIEGKGKDFFSDSKMNARRYIIPEDQEKFLKLINKDYFMSEINAGKTLRLTYRQIINHNQEYVSLKGVKLNNDSSFVIIAISNIDAQKKKENDFMMQLANEKLLARTDVLTGALNKFSYSEFEKEINDQIERNNMEPFAVVVFDINNLKITNDTLGHEAGDKLIKDAKTLISCVFKETTIFRIGGDEFLLILDGDNYYAREYLINQFREIANLNVNDINGVVVACGISEFNDKKDKTIAQVFNRADSDMYKNKLYLKGIEHLKR